MKTIEEARELVADDWAELQQAIRREDSYASHVTTERKDQILKDGLAYAEEIRLGLQDHNFTIRQRMRGYTHGDCPALLP